MSNNFFANSNFVHKGIKHVYPKSDFLTLKQKILQKKARVMTYFLTFKGLYYKSITLPTIFLFRKYWFLFGIIDSHI